MRMECRAPGFLQSRLVSSQYILVWTVIKQMFNKQKGFQFGDFVFLLSKDAHTALSCLLPCFVLLVMVKIRIIYYNF